MNARKSPQFTQDAARERASAARNAPQTTQDAARERASAAHNAPQTTKDAARSAGGTRGEALVLSDNRTAPFGCALMTARLLRVDDAARAALHLRVAHAAPDFVSHSTLHRKSRSPRQRARGLRPSCHPALRAGVLGGDDGGRWMPGDALVLSDIRTAPIGCAPSPAQCPRRRSLHPKSNIRPIESVFAI